MEQIKNGDLLREIVWPLLDWYDRNARILPWRENAEPYRVWVSEIMLQQTRVEAVKPYFERFLQRLPSIQSLAEVSEPELLKLWEGLGYYARVRNLQKAAKMICERFGGVFPERYEDILSLPGIGEYTAGAISSISFGKPVPAVDGNVLRVITRLTENAHDIADPKLKEQMRGALAAIYPEERCGDFTQSLMELGAVVCTPNGIPKCAACPLNGLCQANLHQTQALYPVQAKKAPRKQQQKTVLLLHYQDTIAVRKRAPGGLLGGLWEFPNLEGAPNPDEIEQWLKDHGIFTESITKATGKTHIFTHVEWNMDCYSIRCKTDNDAFLWVTREELENSIALPTAFKKFSNQLWLEPGNPV